GNRRIRKIDTSGVITTVAGGGQAPIANGTPASSASIVPGPLAVDSRGNVYFGNVLVQTAASMIPTIYKINGNGPTLHFRGRPWQGCRQRTGVDYANRLHVLPGVRQSGQSVHLRLCLRPGAPGKARWIDDNRGGKREYAGKRASYNAGDRCQRECL